MGLPNIGPLELIIILAIALLIVGPGRLPEMGSAIGRTIREFRKASTEVGEATRVDAPQKQLPPNTLSEAATPNVATAPAAPAPVAPAPVAADDVRPAAGTASGVKSSGDPA